MITLQSIELIFSMLLIKLLVQHSAITRLPIPVFRKIIGGLKIRINAVDNVSCYSVIDPEGNSREPVSWSSEEISVSRGNLYDHLKLNVEIYEE